MQRGRLVLLASLLVFGCASESMLAYSPVKEKTKLSEDVLFTATRRSLDANRFIAIESSEPFTLTTREKEVFISSVPRLAYRYTFIVTTQGGTLSIRASCVQNSAMSREKYEDCGEERPERVIREQKALHADILKRAKQLN